MRTGRGRPRVQDILARVSEAMKSGEANVVVACKPAVTTISPSGSPS